MYHVDNSHLQNVYHIPYDIQSIKSTSYFFINFRDTTCWWMLREGILKNIKFVHCSKTLTPALDATPPHASQGPARQGIAGERCIWSNASRDILCLECNNREGSGSAWVQPHCLRSVEIGCQGKMQGFSKNLIRVYCVSPWHLVLPYQACASYNPSEGSPGSCWYFSR